MKLPSEIYPRIQPKYFTRESVSCNHLPQRTPVTVIYVSALYNCVHLPTTRHPNATRFKLSPEPPAQPAAPLLGSPPRVALPHSSCLARVSGFPLTFSYSLPHLSGTSLGSASHLRPAAGCSSTYPLSSPGSRHHHPHPNPGCRLLRARVLPATCSSLQHKVRESPLLSPAQRVLTSVPEKPRGPGVPRTRCGDPRLLPSAHFPTSSPASQLLPRHARRGPPRGLCTCRPRRPQPSALPSSPRWEFSSRMSGKPLRPPSPGQQCRQAPPPFSTAVITTCHTCVPKIVFLCCEIRGAKLSLYSLLYS